MTETLAQIRSRIEALGMDFQFTKAITTQMNGVKRQTWLLDYEGAQFVYVAGQKNVVLGWDTNKCSLGEGVMRGLQEEFALGHDYYQGEMAVMRAFCEREIADAKACGDKEKVEKLTVEMAEELANVEEALREQGYASWEGALAQWNSHLSACLSPLRTADIGDMIVEVDSRYLQDDAPSLAQAVDWLKKGPFTLASEDEWEYLCNGGTHTLFRWGDTLDGVLTEIYNVGTVGQTEGQTSSILESPNMLGLFIAYDSYKNEIIDSTKYTKGGDGGRSLCGGDGAIYVLPCYTAFYRYPMEGYQQSLSKNYYCYRRIIRLP